MSGGGTEANVSDIKFVAASAGEESMGLLGWTSFQLTGDLRADGIAVRRGRGGRLSLAFPARRDRAGRMHPYLRPLDDDARERIEAAVIGELRRQGNLPR